MIILEADQWAEDETECNPYPYSLTNYKLTTIKIVSIVLSEEIKINFNVHFEIKLSVKIFFT